MRRVLITGVAGFLGANLAEALRARGEEVIGLDDFSHSSPEAVDALRTQERVVLVEGDVRDAGLLGDLCGRADAVVHLAARKIPRYGDARTMLEVNGLGTATVLAAAVRRKVRTVIASTSDIYGRNPALPFHEESDSLLGSTQIRRWGYAVSKLFGEHMAWACHDEQGLPVSVIRYFGGYGPGQRLSWTAGPQAVFITQALREEAMPIHGSGEQRRTFTYVDDLIDGTLRVLDEPRAVGEVFNLGSTTDISIVELARLIWRLIHGPGREPKLAFESYESFGGRYEDVQRRIPDLSKAERVLGYRSCVTLEEGLRRTIAWQREQLATTGRS